MLRIAAGEGLPFAQQDIVLQRPRCRGADLRGGPGDNFLPVDGQSFRMCVSRVAAYASKAASKAGSVVTPYYNSMLAKLIAHDDTRDAALDLLDAALGETAIFGITTNQDFLRRLIALPETRTADFLHPVDRRPSRRVDWRHGGAAHRGVRIGSVPLADGQARGSLRQPVALACDDRLAHGEWRRGSFADPDPAPRGTGGDRRRSASRRSARTARW